MKTLPNDLNFVRRTPSFPADKIPRAILNRHNTRVGVWGKVVVESGELCYEIYDGDTQDITETVCLHPERHGVVEPQVWHKVTPQSDDTVFHVEFYTVPESDSE